MQLVKGAETLMYQDFQEFYPQINRHKSILISNTVLASKCIKNNRKDLRFKI